MAKTSINIIVLWLSFQPVFINFLNEHAVSSHRRFTIPSNLMLGCFTAVPQGSILGPILFKFYISPIAHHSFGLHQQQYADDTQLYVANSKDKHSISLNQLKNSMFDSAIMD